MITKITLSKRSFFLMLFTFMAFVTYAQQVINTTIQHDGKTRAYRLYIPQSYNSSQPVPLLLNFHGYTNSIDIQYNQSAFQQLAEDNQFIFATPQGLGNSAGWAINNLFGGNEDDLGFTSAMIDAIENQYNINAKRIYATGFSNGGYFSYRLACELSNRIAAVASVAGSMTARWIDNNQCQPVHPTPILQITGVNDGTIPINGGFLGTSINEVMTYWTTYNNGNLNPQSIDLGGGSTRFIYDGGDNGVTAEFIRVGGKGHSWNGGNVETSNEVWTFLSRFDLDGALNPTNPPTNDPCSTTISTFPYTQSFENNVGWTQASGDDGNWVRDSGGTPSSGTGPSSGADGNFYLFLEASTNGSTGQIGNNATALLESPCFDISNLDAAIFTFENHMYGTDVGSLAVEASINGADWSNLWSSSGNLGNQWNTITIDLSAYLGESALKIRFVGRTGNGWSSDIAIDNINLNSEGVVPNPDTCDTINFNNYTINGFSNQDAAGNFTKTSESLSLSNNTWKYIDLNYTVTANTVIEFEFSSTSEGEIHGIGFENDNTLTSSRYFKLYGTQNYGVTNFDTYTSGTTTYIIPVGDSYTGVMDRLVFINDNDSGSGNTSTFTHVKIYEGSCGTSSILAKGRVKRLDILGTEGEGLQTIGMYPNPTRDMFSIVLDPQNTNDPQVSIYNIMGQEQYRTRLEPGTTLFSARDLSLSPGIYFVKIESQQSETILKKLIVKD